LLILIESFGGTKFLRGLDRWRTWSVRRVWNWNGVWRKEWRLCCGWSCGGDGIDSGLDVRGNLRVKIRGRTNGLQNLVDLGPGSWSLIGVK